MRRPAFVALNDAAIAASFDDRRRAPRVGGSVAHPRGRRLYAECQLAVLHVLHFSPGRFGPMRADRVARLIPAAWHVAYTQGEHHYAVSAGHSFTGIAGTLYRNLSARMRAMEGDRQATPDRRDELLIDAMAVAQIHDRYEDARLYRQATLPAKAFADWDAGAAAALFTSDRSIRADYLQSFRQFLAPERDRFWLNAVGPAKPVGDVILTAYAQASAEELAAGLPALAQAFRDDVTEGHHVLIRPYPMPFRDEKGETIRYFPRLTRYHRPSVAAWLATNPVHAGTDDPDTLVAEMIYGLSIGLDNRALASRADLYAVLFGDPRFLAEFSATPADPLRGLTVPETLHASVGQYRSPHVGLPFFEI